MQIIDNVTVYKCEHCNYTDTVKGRLLAHENICLSDQLKKNKNIDKQYIYNILDIDIINIKIKEFLEKYNLPVSSEIDVIKLTLDNSFLPGFELNQSVRGIFDRSKFRLYNELSTLRYSKEYLTKEILDVIECLDKSISAQMIIIDNFNSIKRHKIRLAVQDYLKEKDYK